MASTLPLDAANGPETFTDADFTSNLSAQAAIDAEMTANEENVEVLDESGEKAGGKILPTAAQKAQKGSRKGKNNFKFKPLTAKELNSGKVQFRKVPIPPHRMTPLRLQWMSIYEPLVEQLKLQVRMNVRQRQVEIRTCPETISAGAIQKAADFVRAFTLGFAVADATALLRLDDLYIDTFEIKDVKTLVGDHLSRAIGRIAGRDGKTKFAIENASRTRVVLADTKIHILGSFQNIRLARDALVALVLGSPASKVYGKLRQVANRLKERF